MVTVKLRNDFLKAMNKDEITLAFITDHSKAFDAVDYEILITKLQLSKQVSFKSSITADGLLSV